MDSRKMRRWYRRWRGREVCVDRYSGAQLIWRDSITTVYGHRQCSSCQGTGYLRRSTTELQS